MVAYITGPSVAIAWLLTLCATVWLAAETRSIVAWCALAFIALMPPLALMVAAHAPARTPAEIIHDVETRPSV